MIINVEIEPTSKKEKIISQVLEIKDYVDYINVPDNPFGQIKASSLAISILIKSLNVEPILHIRTIDRNMHAIKSEIYGALLFNIKNILLVKGDIPFNSDFEKINNLRLEKIVNNIAEDNKLKDINLGLPLANFSKYDIKLNERLNSRANFFVTLQINNVKEINEEIIKHVHKYNKKLYSYYVLPSEKNKEELIKFNITNNFKKTIEERIEDVIEIGNVIDGVILSCPLDFDFLKEFLRKLRKR